MAIPTKIKATAPVRICDIGGWTDTWFAGHGAVFNIGVSPLVEVTVATAQQESDDRVRLHLGNYNQTYTLNPDNIVYDKHPLIEASIDSLEIPAGISLDIEIFSKAPAGASIGTSAAVCVALLGALDALTPDRRTPQEIAVLAHNVETGKLGLQSGVQDQLCCAHGGINFIHIPSFPNAEVIPVNIDEPFRQELEKRLVLVYAGSPHNSSEVHQRVIADLGEDASGDPRLMRLRNLAAEARDAAAASDFQALAAVMNQNTQVQRELHPGLVGPAFERIIQVAGSFNAPGCKVNGAGGDGGSVTILGNGNADDMKHLLQSLTKNGFQVVPLSLSPGGVRVWETND
jgi:D-glycero-alpha-D-manno-heptose-7-phosphate kinase